MMVYKRSQFIHEPWKEVVIVTIYAEISLSFATKFIQLDLSRNKEWNVGFAIYRNGSKFRTLEAMTIRIENSDSFRTFFREKSRVFHCIFIQIFICLTSLPTRHRLFVDDSYLKWMTMGKNYSKVICGFRDSKLISIYFFIRDFKLLCFKIFVIKLFT